MKKKVLFGLLLVITLITLTGCGNKEEDGNYKITGGGLNSLDGVYELYEVKGDGVTYTGKEYTNMTTIDYQLKIDKNNTATILQTYKENIDGKAKQDIEKYTYDDEAFYGVDSDNTKEGVKYFTYTFEKGIITLTVVDDTHNSQYVYKKK